MLDPNNIVLVKECDCQCSMHINPCRDYARSLWWASNEEKIRKEYDFTGLTERYLDEKINSLDQKRQLCQERCGHSEKIIPSYF